MVSFFVAVFFFLLQHPLISDAPAPGYFALSQEHISALQLINGNHGAVVGGPF